MIQAHAANLKVQPSGDRVELLANYLRSATDLDNCIAHYGPLSRNLVYAGCTAAVAKIAMVACSIDQAAAILDLEERFAALKKEHEDCPADQEAIMSVLNQVRTERDAWKERADGGAEVERLREEMKKMRDTGRGVDASLLNEFRELEQEMVELQVNSGFFVIFNFVVWFWFLTFCGIVSVRLLFGFQFSFH